jgi:hypothetical protein
VLRGLLAEQQGGIFDFCMCNPPFYDSEARAAMANRSGRRKARAAPACATSSELETAGGEVAFVSRLVADSRTWPDAVLWYTTLLGHKSSVAPLTAAIEAAGATGHRLFTLAQVSEKEGEEEKTMKERKKKMKENKGRGGRGERLKTDTPKKNHMLLLSLSFLLFLCFLLFLSPFFFFFSLKKNRARRFGGSWCGRLGTMPRERWTGWVMRAGRASGHGWPRRLSLQLGRMRGRGCRTLSAGWADLSWPRTRLRAPCDCQRCGTRG